jgi:hypothetical protein
VTLFFYGAVLAIATWRLSRLLSDPTEVGPWDILLRLRYWLGWRWDEFGGLHFDASGVRRQVAIAISCMKCVSVWIGVMLLAIQLISPHLALVISAPFALSGITMIIEEALDDG